MKNKTIYFNELPILIRDMDESDAKIITDEEIAQGWHQTIDKYLTRLKHQKQGICISLIAEYDGCVAGYVNIYKKSIENNPIFQNIPEIVDFGVLEKYRCKGIGKCLMDQAEKIAMQYADTVFLGVGLHKGYGNAQKMYSKRGYILDGSGIWYKGKQCIPYSECINDDDLILYMYKKLY